MQLKSQLFPTLLDLCIRHLLAGRNAECAALAEHILREAPNETIFSLLATRSRPSSPISALGTAHYESRVTTPASDPSQATAATRTPQELLDTKQALIEEICTNPTSSDAVTPCAAICEQLHQFEDAALLYALDLAINPLSLQTLDSLIRCYLKLNRRSDALLTIERAILVARSDGLWLKKLADILMQIGVHGRARSTFLAALGTLTGPALVDTYLALGEIEKAEKNYEASEAWIDRARELDPASYAAQRALVNLKLKQGHLLTAKKLANEFFAMNSRSLSLFFMKTSLELQPGYASLEQLEECRKEYAHGLQVIRSAIPTAPERLVPEFEFLFDQLNPFYLPYQGRSVLELQREVATIYQLGMQRLLQLPPLEPRAPVIGRKIRVGFISGFFRNHSNYKIPIRGWLTDLDRSTFELYGYHTSEMIDSFTAEANGYFHRFVQGPLQLQQWIETIGKDELDVLIYPEIGMDPMCRKLSCLRLAPVQANSWGHPVTSGQPTIDYFLSSSLMEGPDSDREYSEDLVRLPNLSINYSPPPRTLLPISRADLGMRDDAIVYWCCQVIYKYLPQYDWVYAEIAAQVPTSQFAFITIQPQSEMALLFKDRISRAFSAKGLDPAQHIIFLAGLNGDEFATAASLCDISLDAFEWSGCNSSLETMAQGTPVISCPGEFMRGRHSEAILKMIGCDDLIAPTPQSFVELAVRLGTNSALRSQVRSRVRERIPLAYNDLSCVRELEKLIKSWLMPDS